MISKNLLAIPALGEAFSVSSFEDTLSPQSDGLILFAFILPNIFSLVAESMMPVSDL